MVVIHSLKYNFKLIFVTGPSLAWRAKNIPWPPPMAGVPGSLYNQAEYDEEAAPGMKIQRGIESKLTGALAPAHLQVINESHMHSVPPGSESHFKVIVVSERFAGQSLVQRHQAINGLLRDELQNGVHALSMQTLTPEEWARRGGEIMASPACHGGSKAEAGQGG